VLYFVDTYLIYFR